MRFIGFANQGQTCCYLNLLLSRSTSLGDSARQLPPRSTQGDHLPECRLVSIMLEVMLLWSSCYDGQGLLPDSGIGTPAL
jgi:hypothetical protein